MKFAIVIATLVLLVSAVYAKRTIKTFEEFKAAFNKVYDSAEEERIREKNFYASLKYVQENELKNVEINHFSDLTPDEFASQYLMSHETYEQLKAESRALYPCQIRNVSLPRMTDLRRTSSLTPIKNQAACGSCWAFASVGVTESLYRVHHGQVLDLSEQELVDCASRHGCHGDKITTGLGYINESGIVSEKEYPYDAEELGCRHHSGYHYRISDFCMVHPASENTVMQGLAQFQTAAAAIIGIKDIQAFQHYSGGVIQVDNGPAPNWHAINLAGYGTQNGQDYWIVRNSWGENWGMDGFAYFARHQNLMHIDDSVFFAFLRA